jgi:hypothetical protein
VRDLEADTLLRFVRLAGPVGGAAIAATFETGEADDQHSHADRLVGHWRNELVPLAALPGIGGRLAQPVREVLAVTVQSLLVVSLAQLRGVTDEREMVRLVAALALGETLPAGWQPPARDGMPAAPSGAGPDVTKRDGPAAAAPAGPPADAVADPEEKAVWRQVAQKIPGSILEAALEIWTIHQLAGKRADGRLWQRVLAELPAVGVVGAVLGERRGLTDVARRSYAALGISPAELGPAASWTRTASRSASTAARTAQSAAELAAKTAGTAARSAGTAARDIAGRLPGPFRSS